MGVSRKKIIITKVTRDPTKDMTREAAEGSHTEATTKANTEAEVTEITSQARASAKNMVVETREIGKTGTIEALGDTLKDRKDRKDRKICKAEPISRL